MFIISLTYITTLDSIEKYLSEHTQFLQKQYASGYFLLSGRKKPRTGGIIISPLKDQDQLLSILEEDPFKIHNLAKYEITEVIPTLTSEELKYLIE